MSNLIFLNSIINHSKDILFLAKTVSKNLKGAKHKKYFRTTSLDFKTLVLRLVLGSDEKKKSRRSSFVSELIIFF